MTINEPWHSGNAFGWNQALARYMRFVKPADVELIRELEPLNLERIRELDAQGWYDFLFDKYFRWKCMCSPSFFAVTEGGRGPTGVARSGR